MTDIVEVVTADDRWAIVDLEHLANRAACLALLASGINSENYEIALLACDDAKIAELNGQYRGKPGPTNILSWPALRLSPAQDGATPKIPPKATGVWAESLGDLAISFETCQREATESRIAFADHTTHLILHGCLHLLGYDHEREGDAALMEALETKALASIGIDDPYSRPEHVGMEK